MTKLNFNTVYIQLLNFSSWEVDLVGVDLMWVDFMGVDLVWVDFVGVDLVRGHHLVLCIPLQCGHIWVLASLGRKPYKVLSGGVRGHAP